MDRVTAAFKTVVEATGICCSLCAELYTAPHGYPVLCLACWRDATPAERREYSVATAPPAEWFVLRRDASGVLRIGVGGAPDVRPPAPFSGHDRTP